MKTNRELCKMKHILLLASLALEFTSCGIYTNYKSQPIATKNLLREELHADTSAREIPRWEDLFIDPQLQQYIRTALEKNANLAVAHLQLDEAKATLFGAKLAFLPSANLSRGGGLSGSFDGSSPKGVGNIAADVSWTLDIFNQKNNQRKAALASLEEREAYTHAVQTQLIATIAQLYYTLEILDAKLAATEKMIVSWQQSVATQEALFQAGQGQRSNINQAKASQLQAEITRNELKLQIQKIENSLCALLGQRASSIVRGMWGHFVVPEKFSIGLPMAILANRPDVQRAEAMLKHAFYNANAARSALFPSLTLSGSLGWTTSAGVALLNPSTLVWQAAANILTPLLNRSQITTNALIAETKQEEAKIQYLQTILEAGNEINNILADLQNTRTTMLLQQEQIQLLEQTVSDSEAQMQYGTGNYLQIILARQALLSAELARYTTAYKELESYIKLCAAIGM